MALRALVTGYSDVRPDELDKTVLTVNVIYFDQGYVQPIQIEVVFNQGDNVGAIETAISNAVSIRATSLGFTLAKNDIIMQKLVKG